MAGIEAGPFFQIGGRPRFLCGMGDFDGWIRERKRLLFFPSAHAILAIRVNLRGLGIRIEFKRSKIDDNF